MVIDVGAQNQCLGSHILNFQLKCRWVLLIILNNNHSTIKFTSSYSSTNVPFLDVSVSLTNDGSISTDLYTKPTDKHQHLLYSSCHPLHTKKAIPFSLALRLPRICSTDATFNSWFSHDVTKIRTTKLLIFLRFYLNDV